MRFVFLLFILISSYSLAERIKDVASISGVRSNQLIGYGLVVGLDGSGDGKSPFTEQVVRNLLSQAGMNFAANSKIGSKNIAGVVVTANLPAFPSPGMNIDVNVSSLGDAKSLRGGTLLVTPLRGVDGEIYALAQGSVLTGGTNTETLSNAGTIPSGAIVERSVPSILDASNRFVRVELNKADFTSANNVVDAINRRFGANTARALDGRVVEVKAPVDSNERVMFLARLQDIEITPGVDRPVVTINARTGTVVMNRSVSLSPFAISHGNLTVTVNQGTEGPPPGEGVVSLEGEKGSVINFSGAANLADVVKALNAVGATPQDLLSILEAMKAAGALKADLNVI